MKDKQIRLLYYYDVFKVKSIVLNCRTAAVVFMVNLHTNFILSI